MDKIKNGKENLQKTGNSDLDDLIRGLLVEDPENRMNWKDYFEHPFFTKKKNEKDDFRYYYEIIKKIGEAGYAIVYKVKEKKSNEIKAIKVFDKRKIISNFRRKNLRDPTDEEIKPYINSFFNEKDHMEIVEGKNKENNNDLMWK